MRWLNGRCASVRSGSSIRLTNSSCSELIELWSQSNDYDCGYPDSGLCRLEYAVIGGTGGSSYDLEVAYLTPEPGEVRSLGGGLAALVL